MHIDMIHKLTEKLVGYSREDFDYLDVFKPLMHTYGRLESRFSEEKPILTLVRLVKKLRNKEYKFLIAMERGREVVCVEHEGENIIMFVKYKKQAGQMIPISTLADNHVIHHEDGTDYLIKDLLK